MSAYTEFLIQLNYTTDGSTSYMLVNNEYFTSSYPVKLINPVSTFTLTSVTKTDSVTITVASLPANTTIRIWARQEIIMYYLEFENGLLVAIHSAKPQVETVEFSGDINALTQMGEVTLEYILKLNKTNDDLQ